ncbi:HEAT repeat domain-containing protein [Leptolyngbya sp. FACHB-671]|uniref:HEAT repeat domain-containing protein n=1 Tax=Leptolyngbya sp. FACHB-671 TaxID=2692812 RepID=UPI001686DDE4|nr:HEAT repeat domain-containing protein [Leptolyngbya sp. FACHB-671]MBD2068241.1 HEAT repeat domain-containing protein [Leptolyngbya sp. FACHB-671]
MADATSNESNTLDFQPYLQSICHHYQQWWLLYTLHDVEGKETLKRQPPSWDAPFDFGLMVQTVQKEAVSAAESVPSNRPDVQEKVERLPVLEGIRKYASDHVLLIGRPGSGKSTALARLLLEEALPSSPASQDEPRLIPVLVELRLWQTSILDLIRNFFRRHGLNLDRTVIENLLFHNRLLLLVDGLNELPSEAARHDVAKLQRNYSQVPIIFTTRDLNLGGDFGVEKKLEMQPLTTAQMQSFVRSHLEDKAEPMLRQLGERLQEFGQTPLLLWMLCSLFKQTGQIPTNLGGVFRAFTQSYERHLKHDVIAESDRRWWSELLQTLAFAMMHSHPLSTLEANHHCLILDVELRVAISKDEVHQVFVECLKSKEAQPEGAARKCLDDLLRHHLIQTNGEQIEFRHQLIQEYYAAEYLLTRVGQMSDLSLQQQYLNYLKWTEPVALMLALVDDGALAERVVKLALDVDVMLGARLAGEVKPQFQETMVGLVDGFKLADQQEIPEWLKLQLYAKMRPSAIVSDLLKRLKDKDSQVRQHAVLALGALKSEEAIDGLLIAMQDLYADVRRSAAKILMQLRSEYSLPKLRKLRQHPQSFVQRSVEDVLQAIGETDQNLVDHAKSESELSETQNPTQLKMNTEDSDPEVRWSSAEVLGKLNSSEAIPGLLKLLEDSDPEVRWRSAEGLIKLNSSEAIPGLLKLLEDSDPGVRRSSAEVLGKLNSSEAIPGLLKLLEDSHPGVRRSSAEALIKLGSSEAIPGLLKLLEDSHPSVRRRSAEALGKLNSSEAIPGLLKLLEDSHPGVRRSSAEALGKLGSSEAIPGLLKLLEDSDPEVRWRSAEALGKLGSSEAIPGLLKLLEDSDPEVRWRSAEALIKLGSSEAIPGLLKLLEDSDPEVRWRSAEALIKLGSSEAIPGLLKLLEDSHPEVGWRSVEALIKLGSSEAIPGLLKLLEDSHPEVRWRSTEVLIKLNSSEAIPGLLKLLEDSDPKVRWRSAEALIKLGSSEAIPGLLKLLEDSDPEVRWRSAEALIKLGSSEAIPGLLKLLEDSDPKVRRRSAEALIKLGSSEAIPGLLKLLEDSHPEVRWRSAEALGKLGSSEAIPGLLKLLEDSDPEVRWRSAEALGSIVEKSKDRIVPSLPQLLTLVPTESGTTAHGIILAIQSSCKFYNYTLTQISHSMKLFFSYAHKDEALRDTLATHLALLKRQGIISTWHDRDISAGTEWAQAIDSNLNTADIILLLISANFLASDYCYDTEMQRALERHHYGDARVIPILLKPCDWESAPFGKLQALPIAHGAGAKPVTQWRNDDEAFTAIAQGIRKAAEEIKKTRVG